MVRIGSRFPMLLKLEVARLAQGSVGIMEQRDGENGRGGFV